MIHFTELEGGAPVRFPAVVNSIDHSTENRAPNRCLPFDGIGARDPEWRQVLGPDSRLRQACVHSTPRCWGAEPQSKKREVLYSQASDWLDKPVPV